MAKAKQNRQITAVVEPPVQDERRAKYTPDEAKERRGRNKVDPNSEPQGEDRVFSVASRARWGGSDSEQLAEMHRDSRRVESGEEGSEEEEEQEETSFEDMTVADLKAELDAAKVEYPANAKKADLVALAEEHLSE